MTNGVVVFVDKPSPQDGPSAVWPSPAPHAPHAPMPPGNPIQATPSE